jgi:hypothetical protein
MTAPRRRWFRLGLRTPFVMAAFATIVLAYAGSYYQLSRRGQLEAQSRGLPGFLYVPFEEAAATQDLSKHHRLAVFYAPINFLDRSLFPSHSPVDGIMWRLAE